MIKELLRSIPGLLLVCTAAFGQDSLQYQKLLAEGNRYYEDEQYHLAIRFFTDALASNQTDPSVDYKLAQCYRNTFNYPEAEVYYLKVVYTGQTLFPMSLYYYALMLKLNGNTTEAMERFDQFIYLNEDNATLKDFVEQAIIEKAGCEISQQDWKLFAGAKAELATGDINTPYNDFAPVFRNAQSLVITSSRVNSNRTLIDERYGEAFTDNYYFQRLDSTWQNKTANKFSITNSRYNDGSGTFTRNGDRYFFTVCSEKCRIYESHFQKENWTKPEPLDANINDPASESKQPAVSPGGDTLFFASNRAGGYGQFDIWMSIKDVNGWSPARNVGRAINTKANEIAPAVTGLSGVLFFSSNGHPGYGGYDLFVAKNRSRGDTVLYNMNHPFNSVMDDCFLTFNGEELFWSSNRPGGRGGFDVYSNHKLSAIALISKLSLKNRNDSRMVTLTSRTARSENVQLLASRNEETIDYSHLTYERKALVNRMIESRIDNEEISREDFPDIDDDEFYALKDLSHARYQALMLKEKYASTLLTEVVKTTDSSDGLSITGELIDSHTGSPLNSSRILLTDENGDILKITSTNELGKFRFTDVPGDKRLYLRLEKASGHSADAFVKNVQIMNSEKRNSLYVENVYFDFDHYVIRPEAVLVLAGLADYLKANPGAQVEIHAFADDRGSSAYNFELTQKRGEAVAGFLTRYGVDETSLAIIPRGKQSIRRSLNEVQRQYNRRAEFYINGTRQTFSPSVKTYILKKSTDWDVLSKLTGISKQELKKLNGSETEETLSAFQPVRLPLSAGQMSEELFFNGI